MLLHTTFTSLKFSVIALAIVPPKPNCICCFFYILLFVNFTFSQIDGTLTITTEFMIVY